LNNKIQIAVSACLLGQKVRYDGKEKKHALIMNVFLNKYFDIVELVPFCPEVAIGLGVPRAKIQLVSDKNRQKDKQIRVIGVENHTLDVTDELQLYAENFLLQYPDIKYYIVKSKSPSCAYQSGPLFNVRLRSQADADNTGLRNKYDYDEQIELTSGLFVQTIQAVKPESVFIEETQLESEEACEQFFQLIQLS
jgi:uncharacterized protein YbbK (DUF523 family)